ncbi:MAG: protoporphyrinogen oxidase [Firmicutes bacterium HGW-Firmicutes-8]|nr:MAG: protoporphyrinogen oxidase [Firmicutes bacterium HGW-Firmicutes-8]
MKKVVIIGGGITGLAAAYVLQKAKESGEQIDYLLIEKDNRLGGKILTEKIEGYTVEGGPDCFLSEKPWVGEMARKIGIEDRIMGSNEASKRTFVYADGRLNKLPDGLMGLVPTKLIPFALSSLISWPGKIRMAFDLVIPQKKEDSDETLGSFVTRRLGKEALDKIAEPLIGGIHAGDPDQMSLKASFPRFIQMEQKYGSLIKAMLVARKNAPKPRPAEPGKVQKTFFMTFIGGMSDLTETITSSLDKSKIMTGKSVSKVEKKKDGRYVVHISGAEPIEAEAVILTAPANEAAEIVKDLDKTMADNLAGIPQATSATVNLAFKRSDIHKPIDAFGFIVPISEKRKIKAATYSSTKWNYRTPGDDYVLLRAFVGGATNQELVFLDDKEMLKMVLGELRDIIGLTAEPVMQKIYRWVKGMPQYTVGHLQRVETIEARTTAVPGIYVVGGSYKGVGVGDCINVGSQAAEKALEQIKSSSQWPAASGQ